MKLKELFESSDRIRTSSGSPAFTKNYENLFAIRNALALGIEVEVKGSKNEQYKKITPGEYTKWREVLNKEIDNPETAVHQYRIPYQQVSIDTARKILKQFGSSKKEELLNPKSMYIPVQAMHEWEGKQKPEYSYELHTNAQRSNEKQTSHWTIEGTTLIPKSW